MLSEPWGVLLRRVVPTAGLVAVLLIAATSFLTGFAAASNRPSPSGSSGVSQYAELVPTANGPEAPGVGSSSQALLSAKAKRAIELHGGAWAATLTAIATSSRYGAPGRTGGKSASLPRSSTPPTARATASSVVSALGSVSEARLIGTLVALGTITLGGIAIALRQSRS